VAHIALADHATLGIVLGDAVGTVPGAVLATDAGVGAVDHDAGVGILCICFDGATDQAGGLQAMVATHRQVIALRIRIVSAFDFADSPPVDVGWVAVLLVAGDHAALASDALRHVEVEAVLFTGGQGTLGDERGWSGTDLYKRIGVRE
jgi:hypothetical protein